MNEYQTLGLITSAGCLVIAVSALASRRLPASLLLKGALAWIAIFAALYLLLQIDFIRDLIPAANRDRPPVGKDMALISNISPGSAFILHNVYYQSEIEFDRERSPA